MKITKVNIQQLLLALYAGIVSELYVFARINDGLGYNLVSFICLVIFFYFIFDKIASYVPGVSYSAIAANKKKRLIIFIFSALASLLILMVYYISCYPGAFGNDSLTQYNEVITGNYTDWHPALHTLIFFAIPLKITGKIASITLFQMIYFSLVIGYLTLTIFELSNSQFAFFSFCYIMLNPFITRVAMYPLKDVAFGLAGLLSLIFAIRIIYLNLGRARLIECIVLGIVIAFTMIFRHNAVLFIAPLIVALFFKIERKTFLQVLISFFLTFVIVKGPLYNALGVEKPGQRVMETMGFPLTIIANVAKETPELMSEELSEFAYSMATPELYANYSTGAFNSIKYSDGISWDAIEEAGPANILRLMVESFKCSPKASIKAFFELTSVVYGFENGAYIDYAIERVGNNYEVVYSSNVDNSSLNNMLNAYNYFINNSIFVYLKTYGVVLFVILFLLLNKMRFKSLESWKKALLVLPIFTYDFGTMLFLSAPWDSRFFYITFLTAPLLVVYILQDERE